MKTVTIITLILIFVLLTKSAYGLVASQDYFRIVDKENNCIDSFNLIAIPNGQTRFSYVLNENILVKTEIINDCNLTFDFKLFSGDNVILDKIINNKTAIFDVAVKNDKLNMSLQPGIYNVSNNHGKRVNTSLDWTNKELSQTKITKWTRKLDLSGGNALIEEEFILENVENDSSLELNYQGLENNIAPNFLIKECSLNEEECSPSVIKNPGKSSIIIENLNQSNTIKISYYAEGFIRYSKFYFPFDTIETIRLFPTIVVKNEKYSIDVNNADDVSIMITLPNGFTTDFWDSILKYDSTTKSPIDYGCRVEYESLFTGRTAQFLVPTDLFAEFEKFQLLSKEDSFVFNDKIENGCQFLPYKLIFNRNEFYLLFFYLIIFICLIFSIRTIFVREKLFENFKDFLILVILAITGNFLILPRPPVITIFDIILVSFIFFIGWISLFIKLRANSFRKKAKRK